MIISIEFLNNKGIFHRDLKPANFLLHEFEGDLILHLNDFGITKDVNDESNILTSFDSNKGTTAYMAPEYLNRD